MFSEDNDEDVNKCNDDNSFYLNDYDWRNRVKILDAKITLDEIRNKVNEENKKARVLQRNSDILSKIKFECIKEHFFFKN